VSKEYWMREGQARSACAQRGTKRDRERRAVAVSRVALQNSHGEGGRRRLIGRNMLMSGRPRRERQRNRVENGSRARASWGNGCEGASSSWLSEVETFERGL
jgi:hypothetical protein